MSTSATSDALAARRRALALDAVVSGAGALGLLVGAPFLDDALGVSTAFMLVLGVSFVAFTATLVALMRRGAPVPAVRVVAIGNLGWGVLSIAVVLADGLGLTAAGTVVAVLQALAVGVFGTLQLASARRA